MMMLRLLLLLGGGLLFIMRREAREAGEAPAGTMNLSRRPCFG